MLDPTKKDVKVNAIGKSVLDMSQMDLTGFRMGKERLVSKKKKKSALKRVIIAEREDRKLDAVNTPVSNSAPPAVSTLSVDAPEFVPSFWSSSSLADQSVHFASASTGAPTDSNRIDGETTPQEPKAVAPFVQAADEPIHDFTAQTLEATDEFVPSWHQEEPPGDPAPVDWQPGELLLAEAMARMRTAPETAKQTKKPQVQTRAVDFEVRHYVRQVLSEELDEKLKLMLGELVRFQERAKERDPLKYAKQKRFCVGMREAQRAVARGKAKCLILAPNMESCSAKGGLDDTVENLMDLCQEGEVPVVFALSRNRIGKALGKSIRLSIVTVLSAEGVHQHFKEVVKLTEDLRRQWVLRRMASANDEDLEVARQLAAEKTALDEARRERRVKLEAERKAELEAQRIAEKAARVEEKARRKEEAQKRHAERAAARREQEASQKREEQEAEEAAKKAAEEELQGEAMRRAEIARKEAARRAEEEKRRAEEEARIAAEKAAKAENKQEGKDEEDSSDYDSDSDDSVPAGFNADLF